MEDEGQESQNVMEAVDSPKPRTSVYQEHKLHTYEWKPKEGEIKALLYIGHGVSEYMGRYEKLANHLSDNGILVFGLDYVGHGRSEGVRIDVETFDTYVEDIVAYVDDMQQLYPSLPVFLMGHSMGGLIAVLIALSHHDKFTGLILSSPATYGEIGTITKFFGRLMSYIAPQLGVKSFSASQISTIPEEIQAYEDDPLIYRGALKARIGTRLVDAMDSAVPRLGEIKLPLLLFHGEIDTLVPIRASHIVDDNIGSSEKIFEVFEGSRHEVLHDKDQDRARQLISDWVLEKLASTPCDTPPVNEQAETTKQAESTEQAETTHQQAETTEQAEITEQPEITGQAETTEQAETTKQAETTHKQAETTEQVTEQAETTEQAESSTSEA